MFDIYPAIDLYQGKVVRLKRGAYDQVTVYSGCPEDIAAAWEAQGARWIHVVDLEGAREGRLVNRAPLVKIRKSVGCQIQFGGGIREAGDVENVLSMGIDRVILGTKALDESFLGAALDQAAERMAVGLDVRDGIVQTQGWISSSERTLEKTLEILNRFPIGTMIYTDIQKDGMLEGPNIAEFTRVLEWAKSRVILSGGIHSLDDIRELGRIKEKNFSGVIIGKALYDKKFTLPEALAAAG